MNNSARTQPAVNAENNDIVPEPKCRPLRVATLLPNIHVSGPETRMSNFALHVDRTRIEFEFIVISKSRQRDQVHGSVRQQLQDADIKVVDLEMPPWEDRLARLDPRSILRGIWRSLQTIFRIRGTLRKHRIDVVELHGHVPIILGTIAAVTAGSSFAMTAYDMHFWDRPMWRTMARCIFLLHKALITDSQQRADEMNEFFWRPIPTYVIPNGIAVPVPVRSREEVAEDLGITLDPEVTIVGQVSRLDPTKGHRIVVEAARTVLKRCPNTIFLICGYVSPRCPPDYPEKLRGMAREYGFGDKLFVFGYPGYIGDIHQLIDVQVHASLKDSSPISIHEGMSLGKPAVGTDEGGIPELIVHEHSGLIVPKNDPQALASALIRILMEPDTAARFAKNAQLRYEERHRPEVMAKSLEELFLKLAGRDSVNTSSSD